MEVIRECDIDVLSAQEEKLLRAIVEVRDPTMLVGILKVLGVDIMAYIEDKDSKDGIDISKVSEMLIQVVFNFRKMPRKMRREIINMVKKVA